MPTERSRDEALNGDAHSAEAFESQYELRDQLGVGGFGSVHVAIRRADGERLAVKKLAAGRMDEDDIKREVAVLMALDNPHVLQTHGVFLGAGEEILLLVELARGGELFSWIGDLRERGIELSPNDHRRLVRELFVGLEYLHRFGVMHRDIKPSNLLLTAPERDAPLVIADFGLCARLRKPKVRGGGSGEPPPPTPPVVGPPVVQVAVRNSLVGTPSYMAPEMVLCAAEGSGASGYSFPCDVWSAGCVVFALLTEDEGGPFGDECGEAALFEAILNGRYPVGRIDDSLAQVRGASLLLLLWWWWWWWWWWWRRRRRRRWWWWQIV